MAGAEQPALAEALDLVRGRIEKSRERGHDPGEQDTKASLIEPVLTALGWQLDDLDEVRREYKRKPQDNPADYALFVHRQPQLFVEAKALNVALGRKCASQVVGYAGTVGVGWCLVTNGDEYRIYNAHARMDVDEKLFRTVKLSDPTQKQACLETLGLLAKEQMCGEIPLETLWKTQFVDRRLRRALDVLFEGEDQSFVRLIRKHAPELSPADIKSALARAQLRADFPEKIRTPRLERGSAPDVPAATQVQVPGSAGQPRSNLSQLISTGNVKPPLEIEHLYKGKRLTATIAADGNIEFEGKTYATPSAAGGAARAAANGSPNGAHPATNGWVFWRYRDPVSGELMPLERLQGSPQTGKRQD